MPQDSAEVLRVIIEHDPEDGIVAQCVDYDIAGIGASEDEAIRDFCRAYVRHVLVARHFNEKPLSNVPPPAGDYLERWALAAATAKVREFDIQRYTIHKIDKSVEATIPRHCLALVS